MKRIGVLTSGGDAPGMNAAIRSVVRCALFHQLEVMGIYRGYAGLLKDEIDPLNHRSVSNILNRGGTVLKTDRSEEFKTEIGQKKAVEIVKKHGIDALVLIGGDGTYAGGQTLTTQWNIPCIGLPGTIDNDIRGTDFTIGSDTAVNTALEAIDKIRDTATSMERIFVVEVMGNKSGYIAMQVALGGGAEDVLIPEREFDISSMERDITEGYKRGKMSWIIIVAEGAGKAGDIAEEITNKTGLETRVTVLGHVQRGGTPTANDRILATRLGAAAVELLIKGEIGKVVGVVADKINTVDFKTACEKKVHALDELYKLSRILT
ncbi:6-phosphofructokinase [Candidatus Omnitrophota bacterium]